MVTWNLPIHQMKMPADLQGQSNGKISTLLLRDFPLGEQAHGEPLHHWAYHAFISMRTHAQQDGFWLGLTDGYRPIEKQVQIFLQRYTLNPREAKMSGGRFVDVKSWRGKRWYLSQGATAAVPGTSNHGWGLAIDLCELDNGRPRSISDRCVTYLSKIAPQHGFSWELQKEDWHIRYVAGVAPPGYGGPVTPPTAPPTAPPPQPRPVPPPHHPHTELEDVMLEIHHPVIRNPGMSGDVNLDFGFLTSNTSTPGVKMHSQVFVRSLDGAAHLFNVWSSGYGLLSIVKEGPFSAMADGRPAVVDVKQDGLVTVELLGWAVGTWEVWARESWIRL